MALTDSVARQTPSLLYVAAPAHSAQRLARRCSSQNARAARNGIKRRAAYAALRCAAIAQAHRGAASRGALFARSLCSPYRLRMTAAWQSATQISGVAAYLQ